MNVYVLDEDPKKAAEYHCDIHAKSEILTCVQMLSSVHWLALLIEEPEENCNFITKRSAQNYLENKYHVGHPRRPPYKMTHLEIPIIKWIASNKKNYLWVVELLKNLDIEFQKRYKKKHKSALHINWLEKNIPSCCEEDDEPIKFLNNVPEDFILDNVVESYRNYYKKGKTKIAVWDRSENKPYWF
jgi:hypothetical protein